MDHQDKENLNKEENPEVNDSGLLKETTEEDNQPAIYEWNFDDYEAIEQSTPKSKYSKGLIFLSVFLFLALIAVIMMFGIYVTYNRQKEDGLIQNQNGPSLILNDIPSSTEEDSDGGKTTSVLASEVMPSVVGIVIYNYDNTTVEGQGSGVVMDSNGYIITNSHVLLDSNGDLGSNIKVILYNEAEYEAELIGADDKTDLAVIKIDAQNLVAAEFGDSDQVVVGDRVIAIGNPGGVDFMGSVSQGIISGLNRSIRTDSGYSMTLMQTDAAINPGNSGGTLVNKYGQVIAINTAKIRQEDYEGIGFSIPINTVKPIVDDLIDYGYVQDRVTLGITYQEVDTMSSKESGISTGLFVLTVDKSISAGKNGLRAGDIITAIDGQSIETEEDLNSILDSMHPGDTVEIKFIRTSSKGNTTMVIETTLAEDTGSYIE